MSSKAGASWKEMRSPQEQGSGSLPGSCALESQSSLVDVKLDAKTSSKRTCRALVIGGALFLTIAAATTLGVVLTRPSTTSTSTQSSLIQSIPLRKIARQRPWSANTSSLAAHRHLSEKPNIGLSDLEGAAFADYSAQVTIGSQTFEAIIDTGSSYFAIAASSSDKCKSYYQGTCSSPSVSASYGSGSWSGQTCSGTDVYLGDLYAGQPNFVGITLVDDFLKHCEPGGTGGIIEEGILGMAYQPLISQSGFVPLFSSVVSRTGIDDIFSLQCCGWDGGDTPGTGTLVLGGIDESFYTGAMSWMPIISETYYCVGLICASTPGGSCSRTAPPSYTYEYAGGDPGFGPGIDVDVAAVGGDDCHTVIDSGTSGLILHQGYKEAVERAQGDGHISSEAERDALPNITLKFEGFGGKDVILTIPPSRYYQPPQQPGGDYEFLVSIGGRKNIIGQVVMEQYYTVFNRASKAIGFAEISGCGSQRSASPIASTPSATAAPTSPRASESATSAPTSAPTAAPINQAPTASPINSVGLTAGDY